MKERIRHAGSELAQSRLARTLWLSAGVLSLVLGVIGIFLPVMPTTPFLILAAACFARSSPRFYEALINHPVLGPPIHQWRQSRTIPRRAKGLAITLMILTLGSSIVFFVKAPWVRGVLTLVGISVILWLLRLPTRRPELTFHPSESRDEAPGNSRD